MHTYMYYFALSLSHCRSTQACLEGKASDVFRSNVPQRDSRPRSGLRAGGRRNDFITHCFCCNYTVSSACARPTNSHSPAIPDLAAKFRLGMLLTGHFTLCGFHFSVRRRHKLGHAQNIQYQLIIFPCCCYI